MFAAPNWAGFIRHNSQKHPLTAINRSALSGDEIVLYTDFWTRSPGHEAPFLKERKTREILLETASFQPAKNQNEDATLVGRVVEIRDDGKSFPIAKGQFVLAAAESAIPFFRHVKQGQTIEVGWRLTDLPASVEWQDITDAGAGAPFFFTRENDNTAPTAFGKHVILEVPWLSMTRVTRFFSS